MHLRLIGQNMRKSIFQGQLKCHKNGFDPRKNIYPAVLFKIQPFLELKEPEILPNRPY